MADQEVIKHTKEVINIMADKKHSFWHKLKDFFMEIFIIVFAISLSIWLHERSSHNHQQKEVKEFLLGVKEDLKSDVKEMTSDKFYFTKDKKALAFINRLKFHETLNADSLKVYSGSLFNMVGLISNTGRFEGFKSSGKIGTIENQELQNDILDLYQELVPSLLTTTEFFNKRKEKLNDYITKNMKRTSPTGNNLHEVLSADEGRNLCLQLAFTDEILARYDTCIEKSEKIIKAIEKEYQE